MILKGVFTQGKHVGKSVSDPTVSAEYLRMAMWHGDFGVRVDADIKVELSRRGEVHFDITYNEEYRRQRRAETARQKARQASRTPRPKSTSAPALSQDQISQIEIINAGRQALAKRHHPDVGGDEEKMKAVNGAANTLLEMVRGGKL